MAYQSSFIKPQNQCSVWPSAIVTIPYNRTLQMTPVTKNRYLATSCPATTPTSRYLAIRQETVLEFNAITTSSLLGIWKAVNRRIWVWTIWNPLPPPKTFSRVQSVLREQHYAALRTAWHLAVFRGIDCETVAGLNIRVFATVCAHSRAARSATE